MNTKIRNYVDVLFSDAPRSKKAQELKQEILASLNEHFEEYIAQGKSENQAYSQAVADLGGNLVFLDDETLNAQEAPSPSRASLIGLAGVAEPSALVASKRKELVLAKQTYGSVTVAIAR